MSDEPGAYERSGKGDIATEGELENKFATYDNLNDPNPSTTEAMKEKIRQLEETKFGMIDSKDDDSEGKEKGGGLLSKLNPLSKKNKAKDNDNDNYNEGGSDELSSTMSKPVADPDHDHIVMTHHNADADAPTLVVKEQ